MGKNKNKGSSNYHMSSFFLVRAREGYDARSFAKELLDINGVEEVILTAGDLGFGVRASAEDEKLHQIIEKDIEKKAGECAVAISHENYKRGKI